MQCLTLGRFCIVCIPLCYTKRHLIEAVVSNICTKIFYFVIIRKHNNYKNRLSPSTTCFDLYVTLNRNLDFGFFLYLQDNCSYTHTSHDHLSCKYHKNTKIFIFV